MTHLRVKNWDRFQHYKNSDSPPPWIKLYTEILTDYEFLKLGEADRFKLVAIWLLAAKTRNETPDDPAYIARVIGVRKVNVELFISSGFLERVYNDSRPALVPVEEEKKDLRAVPREEPRSDDHEHSIVRLLSVLLDADSQTESVIRSMVKKHHLADGDLEAARDAATGPGVESPTKVAVAELKKRAA